MKNLARALKDYQDSGALNSLIGVTAVIGPNTFITKSGHLMTILKVQGIDDECLDAAAMEQITHRVQAALSVFDENFRIYQYFLKRERPNLPSRVYADPTVQGIVQNRIDDLQGRSIPLYSIEIYWAVAYEGWRPKQDWKEQFAAWLRSPKVTLEEKLSTHLTLETLKRQVEQAEELLTNRANALAIQLRDAIPMEILDADAGYRFLRRLLNYTPYKAESVGLKYNEFVDFQACDSLLECERNHLRLDDDFVQVLTLKDPPGQTFAHVFRGLEAIPANMILASEWKRETDWAIRKVIKSKQRHFHISEKSLLAYATTSEAAPRDALIDEGAVANVSDLGSALRELEFQGNHFGRFSMTVILYGDDPVKLRRSVAEVSKVFSTHGAQLTEETYNQLNAWLAVIPGNSDFNVRHLLLMNTNYADLAFVFRPSSGELENRHLGTEYLAVFETNQHTPFFLNLLYGDVAHAMALGMTGSGKSFLMNFLLAQAQKYQPFTFIFDLGGSYRSLTRLFRGTYVPVGIESQSFSINPFCLPATKENQQFQFSFVKQLIESGGCAMTSQEDGELFEQIESLYVIDADQRRLGTLAQILSRKLAQPLSRWVGDGQYGRLFDNATDNLTLARFQTFDFEGMNKYPQVLEPLLFYILHRASAAVIDDQQAHVFKVFMLDEAWRFLQHPTTKAYILEALKTWRKRNAAMVLATQSSEDLLRSEMLGAIVESCPTKLFLANPGMDIPAYKEIFHLSQTEAEIVSRLIPKKQILLKRPDLAKVLNLNVDRKGYWLCSNDPRDNEKKHIAFERHGMEQGLAMLEKEQLP